MLAARNFPAHRTICKFRRRHLEDFGKLLVEVVGLARQLGLARFGKLSIDGTKSRANASKRNATSYRRMKQEGRRLHRRRCCGDGDFVWGHGLGGLGLRDTITVKRNQPAIALRGYNPRVSDLPRTGLAVV